MCQTSPRSFNPPEFARTWVVLLLLALIFPFMGQTQSIQERLGYSADTKLLIIHSDDLGASHSENAASIYAMEHGSVNSASIMVPCPWFPEIADYARNHPDMDFGLHLTLTSEWKHLQWGPVIGAAGSSLTDDRGYFYRSVAEFAQHANLDEVRAELRAQVDRALEFGINVTHLDTHMGSLLASADLAEIYVEIGREYNLPVLLSVDFLRMFGGEMVDIAGEGTIMVDDIYVASPPDQEQGFDAYYSGVLNNLDEGLSVILIHTAYDDAEMKAVCIDHPNYGSAWRQDDFDFFTSDTCRELIEKNNIVMITWSEIGDQLLNQD